jgi:hypothetical protein
MTGEIFSALTRAIHAAARDVCAEAVSTGVVVSGTAVPGAETDVDFAGEVFCVASGVAGISFEVTGAIDAGACIQEGEGRIGSLHSGISIESAGRAR